MDILINYDTASPKIQVWSANGAITPKDAPEVGVFALKMQNRFPWFFLNILARDNYYETIAGRPDPFFCCKMHTRRWCVSKNFSENAKLSPVEISSTIK